MDDRKEDARYFESYATSGIHEEMIKDSARTKGYQRAIMYNKKLFANKIVLDVGCGTGILSLFAADAGAKHVYSIDNSNIIDTAKLIIKKNNYEDRITMIKGKVEEVELPVQKVDIIISEWMGYALLYESMLDCVIFARDKWLINGGLMFPDVANLYMCGIEDEEYRDLKVDWWNRVYTYDMSPMREISLSEPIVDYVEKDFVITTDSLVRRFDLYRVTTEEVHQIESNIILCSRKQDFVHALVLYFSVEFSACHKPVFINTGPSYKQTHWKQTIFYVTDPIAVHVGESVFLKIKINQNQKYKRCLDFSISQHKDNTYSEVVQKRNYYFS